MLETAKLVFKFYSLNFRFVSDFDIRISDFDVLGFLGSEV